MALGALLARRPKRDGNRQLLLVCQLREMPAVLGEYLQDGVGDRGFPAFALLWHRFHLVALQLLARPLPIAQGLGRGFAGLGDQVLEVQRQIDAKHHALTREVDAFRQPDENGTMGLAAMIIGQLLACGRVPETDRPFATRGRQHLAVGREGGRLSVSRGGPDTR